jgi:acetoin utilization deacetylase AcuC-like enzyme
MAMDEIVDPLIRGFEPQLIIRNGGGDPLYTDILTNLGLDLDSLTRLHRRITGRAKEINVPLLDIFLSGYGPYVTEGWLAIIRGLMDEPMELSIPEQMKMISGREQAMMHESIRGTLDELKLLLKPFWNTFR